MAKVNEACVNPKKIDINKSYLLLYSYSLLLGFIYSYSFWSAFNISIIMYIDILDILKFSLMPLLLVAIPLIPCIMLLEFLFFHGKHDIVKHKKKHESYKNITLYLSLTCILACIILIFMYSLEYINKTTYIGLFFSVPLYFLLKNYEHVKFIRSQRLRSIFIYFILIMPWLAYDAGKIYAKIKFESQNCHGFIDYNGQKIHGLYIGHINRYFFVKKFDSSYVYVIDTPGLAGIDKGHHHLFK